MFVKAYEVAKNVSFGIAGCAGLLLFAGVLVRLVLELLDEINRKWRSMTKRGAEFREFRRCAGDFDTYKRDRESKRKYWEDYYKEKYRKETMKCDGDCPDCSKSNCSDRV